MCRFLAQHRRGESAATLRYAFGTMVFADQAFGQTLALLATFLGIGVLVNVLIVYIIGQVLAERKQNQEYRQGPD
jgi:hypothetical protein